MHTSLPPSPHPTPHPTHSSNNNNTPTPPNTTSQPAKPSPSRWNRTLPPLPCSTSTGPPLRSTCRRPRERPRCLWTPRSLIWGKVPGPTPPGMVAVGMAVGMIAGKGIRITRQSRGQWWMGGTPIRGLVGNRVRRWGLVCVLIVLLGTHV